MPPRKRGAKLGVSALERKENLTLFPLTRVPGGMKFQLSIPRAISARSQVSSPRFSTRKPRRSCASLRERGDIVGSETCRRWNARRRIVGNDDFALVVAVEFAAASASGACIEHKHSPDASQDRSSSRRRSCAYTRRVFLADATSPGNRKRGAAPSIAASSARALRRHRHHDPHRGE